LDLTWKQYFIILVDSEIFGGRSIYQFEIDSEETRKTFTHYFIKINTVNLENVSENI